jgi:hypothetical protein
MPDIKEIKNNFSLLRKSPDEKTGSPNMGISRNISLSSR